MKYQATPVVIQTVEEFQAARAAGAEVQFTAWDDDPLYLPRRRLGESGWIVSSQNEADYLTTRSFGQFRAFYPVQP